MKQCSMPVTTEAGAIFTHRCRLITLLIAICVLLFVLVAPPASANAAENATGPTYPITVDEYISDGTVTPSVSSAAAGDIVTVNVTPEEGYMFTSVSYFNKDYYYTDITATDGVYSFIMPPESITVTAWFWPVPPFFTLSAGSGNLFASLTYDEINYGEAPLLTSGTDRLTVYASAATASAPAVDAQLMEVAAEDITAADVQYFTLSMQITQGQIPHSAYLWMESEGYWEYLSFYDDVSESYKEMATVVLPWPGIGGEAVYYGEVVAEDHETVLCVFFLTIVGAADPIPNPGGGGGGGAGSGEAAQSKNDYDVINETNTENVSSDTTLTLHNSVVDHNGVSTTEVDAGAIDALLELAERHKKDVPEGTGEAIINISDSADTQAQEYVVTMKRSDLQRLIDSPAVDTVEIRTSRGSIRLYNEALNGLDYDENGNVKINLKTFDFNGRPGVDYTVENSGVEVVETEGAYGIQIRIPYVLQEGETAEGLVIEYIREDGTAEIVTECRYDEANGYIYGYVEHLSKFAVSYKVSLFSDVSASHWANGYIIFLASRGIINGMGDGSFRPDANVTRAQFVNMITKAFSTAKVGEPVQVYPDVKATEWYAPAVTWSYMNNIANAIVSNNQFRPNSNLTREDMATLSNNASLGMSLRLKENVSPIIFNDEADISNYAENSVQRMVRCGIIAGMDEGVFLPGGTCTRAQAAKVISELLSKM